MSRSRASTPAGRRRTSGRSAAGPARSSQRAPRGRRPSSTKRPARRRPSAKRPRARRRGSWRFRLAIGAVLAAALVAGYFLWLRESSLVAVTDVDVAGVESGDPDRIVAELTAAGEEMTTLHVQPELVERAAARFPTIESVTVDASFPHGLRIEVSERPPTMLVSAGDDLVPIAADGTVLTGVDVSDAEREELPKIELDEVPTSGALGGEPLEQARVAGAAPRALRPLIAELGYDDEHGVVATLRGDIPVFFGSGARAAQKWAAASAVLADPKLTALTYLDVRVPERPAVGGAA